MGKPEIGKPEMGKPETTRPEGARPAAPLPVRVGRVVSISGARLVVLVDRGRENDLGVQMGALVKITGGDKDVIGLVEGLSIPIPNETDSGKELRIAEVSLLGEIGVGPQGQRVFHRGVARLPSLDDVVLLADQKDAQVVYTLSGRNAVHIGTVQHAHGVPASLSVNDLLGKHFAILGTTGTGKSCALTLILKRILAQNPHAHVLLLDPHGEYGHAFGKSAEHLSGDSLRLPYWIFNFEEIVEVVFGAEKDQHTMEIIHLRDLIIAAKNNFAAAGSRPSALITVDTPVPYAIGEMNRLLDETIGRLENRSALGPYLNLKARLTALQADRRYNFMFATGFALRDNLSSLLGLIFRVPADGKPISIIDLAGIPSEVLNVVVAVICRMAFDFALWGGQQLPLLLVCEEAHRYAPQDAELGFEPAKRGLARIAKEGRKYGISLGVLSQRPSDLAASILSQCSTVISFRMTNEKDQEIIQASLSDVSSPLFNALPLLGNGEALVVGEGVPVPMRMRIAALPKDEQPRSSSASFSSRWQEQSIPPNILERIVECWRGQKAPEHTG